MEQTDIPHTMHPKSILVITEYFEDFETRYERIALFLREMFHQARLCGVLYSRYAPLDFTRNDQLFDQTFYANSQRRVRMLSKQVGADVVICLVGHNFGLDDLGLYISVVTASVPRKVFSLRNLASLQTALSSPQLSRRIVSTAFFAGIRNFIESSLKVYLLSLLVIPLIKVLSLIQVKQRGASKKILMIRLDLLGDMIVTLPYLALLRKQFPESALTVLTTSRGAAIIREQMDIGVKVCDNLLVWDPPWHCKRSLLGMGDVLAFVRRVPELLAGGYDLVLQPVPIGTGVMVAALTCGNVTVAVIDPTLPLSRIMGGYVSHPVRLSPKKNYHMRDLLEMTICPVGVYSSAEKTLVLSDRITAAVKDMLHTEGSQKIVILNIGAGSRLREWGEIKFAGLIGRLSGNSALKVVLIGGVDDREKATRIIDLQPHCGVVNLAGQLSLNMVASALSLAEVVVTADTGIMHLAAVVDTRIVAIYGAGNVHYCHPISDDFVIIQHELGCSGCADICFTDGVPPCIDSVTVDEVYNATLRMLLGGEVQI